MAENFEASEPSFDEPNSQAASIGLVAQILSAVLSITLAISISVWAYKLVVRDVSGIPVISASNEPMRVAPENPGGMATAHQGLSVNEVAEEVVSIDPEQVTLAPRPVALIPDDLPPKDLSETMELTTQDTILNPSTETDMAALANKISKDALSPEGDEKVIEVVTLPKNGIQDALREALKSNDAVADISSGTMSISLRPRKRPSDAGVTTVAVNVVRDIELEDLAVGTALVQLGAFDSDNVARTVWLRLRQKFPSFMTNRGRVIQRATSGGKVFYRLRAEGFEDLDDARRFCALLVASNADCIPVTVR
jgi:hypothetical protein